MEFSTQSVKIVAIDLVSSAIEYTGSFNYDDAFPEYGTSGGVLPSESPDVRHTSPLMLTRAVDFAFQKMARDGLDLSKVRAIKTDCMQHCTICTNKELNHILKRLDPARGLASQMEGCFSRKSVPIWEDRSPQEEVEYLTKSLQPYGGIHMLTGNRAELRFPAAQILKWARQSPAEYEQTANIFILSAFFTSVLAGQIALVDTGDGWGSNLNHLDLVRPGWSHPVVSVADAFLKRNGHSASLAEKIGGMVPFDTIIGTISPYFAKRYKVNPDAVVLAGTGDNPATLMSCGGNIVISLGSSYTVNGAIDVITPSKSGEYNIFGYAEGRAMALSVITNGGKVHDYFRKKLFRNGSDAEGEHSREKYTESVGGFRLVKDEKLMLPYMMDESVPLRKRGIVCDGFSENDTQTAIRALHLSQVLSLKLHSDHLSYAEKIYVVGGGAKNPVMRQWLADAFNADIHTFSFSDMAAPLGCAISGAAKILGISYRESFETFLAQKEDDISCRPTPESIDTMTFLINRYARLEAGYRR